jgi:hypothetical protein
MDVAVNVRKAAVSDQQSENRTNIEGVIPKTARPIQRGEGSCAELHSFH